MTSSQPPAISLTATAAELPVSWDVAPAKNDPLQTANATNYMVVLPNKPSDMMLRAYNNGEHQVHLRLEIEGDFPASWFLAEGWEQLGRQQRWKRTLDPLLPRDHLSEIITFTVPPDFFEQQRALVHQEKLHLEHQVRLYLFGDTSKTEPERLVGYQAMSLYVRPPIDYLDFLPEIYQQSDFLSRFLSIFEQGFDPTVQTLDAFWAYLNPLTAPKALLPFLAEWVAWPMNPRWTVKQQRRLIRYAVEIYQWRGTHRGLQFALSLVTGLPQDDQHIAIAEDHLTDFVIGDITLADAPSLGGGRAFYFTVTLRPSTPEQANYLDEAIIRAVIEQEKPAFCTYDLFIDSAFSHSES
jgi:phage tail-like protein